MAKRKAGLSRWEGSDSRLHLHPGRASGRSSHLRDSLRKPTTGRPRLGLQRRSAPRSRQGLGLSSLMAPVSPPSPRKPLYSLWPASKWRNRSVGRTKGLEAPAWETLSAHTSWLGVRCSALPTGECASSRKVEGGPRTRPSSLPIGTCVCLH